MRQPQALLAYAMNGQPLPTPHGAPLRLRAIEVVADYRGIDAGQGGSREDNVYYEHSVSI